SRRSIYSSKESWKDQRERRMKNLLAFGIWYQKMFWDFFSYRRVNRESKRLDRVLVVEFIGGEQFVTEEINEEGNRWLNIEVRTRWYRNLIWAASLNRGTITVYED
ncbi:hypothetical protein Tco_0036722, partial [Tanacetum coccineum]